MTTPPEPARTQHTETERDAAEARIDQEAAEIDARDPDAPERIAELEADAHDLGLPRPEPAQVDVGDPEQS
jgi:hypothetical protein